MREKLIELVGQVQDCGCDVTDVVEMNYVENITLVDHLIANGVTVQGDKDTNVLTNADRIRAMSDETLAMQLVQVVKETIKVLTDLDVPYEILNEIGSCILEELKQPADMRGEEDGN